MSYMGNIVCRKCKLILGLGKFRANTVGGPIIGFWGPGDTIEESERIVSHFMAEHIRHDLIVIGEEIYGLDLRGYEWLTTFKPVDEELAARLKYCELGDVQLYRRLHEGELQN